MTKKVYKDSSKDLLSRYVLPYLVRSNWLCPEAEEENRFGVIETKPIFSKRSSHIRARRS